MTLPFEPPNWSGGCGVAEPPECEPVHEPDQPGVCVGAILDGVRTMADGTLKVSFALNETGLQAAAGILGMHQQFGWLIFSPNPGAKIPDEPPMDTKTAKTPAQRLRAVLFLVWKQLGAQGDFDVYYRREMEAFIELCKTQLDERE